MDAHARRWMYEKGLDTLAGLQLGVLGGILVLVWYALISPVLAQPWWILPNLYASKYFLQRTIMAGPGFVTVSGAALHLTFSGIIGAIAGFANPGSRLVGLGTAVAWYLICYFYLWKRTAPGLVMYTPQPVLAVGYFLYGSVLGYYPQTRRGLTRSVGETPAA